MAVKKKTAAILAVGVSVAFVGTIAYFLFRKPAAATPSVSSGAKYQSLSL